jgi:arsenite-transporting ATPase
MHQGEGRRLHGGEGFAMLARMSAPARTQPLAGLIDRRVVLVTGKGGVGKTTVTAAIARLAREAGKRVLVGEVGAEPGSPSPLRQLLTGQAAPLPDEPVTLEPGLDAVLFTPESGHRAFLREVLPLGFLADRALKAEPLRRFLNGAPAFAELGVLYRGLQAEKETLRGARRWDLIVLDAPASGHALALASLPEVALKVISGGPIGRALRDGHALLTDPARTIAVVTTLPEALPVSEALELASGLRRARVRVHGVVANLVPEDPFTQDEHVALDAWLAAGDGAQSVLGTRLLGKLRRARAAVERLRTGADELLYTVREHAGRGPELVRHVASELSLA